MKKITLRMDTLQVESFEVEAKAAQLGTVRANIASGQPWTCESCDWTCATQACPCKVSVPVTNCAC